MCSIFTKKKRGMFQLREERVPGEKNHNALNEHNKKWLDVNSGFVEQVDHISEAEGDAIC